MGEQNLFFLDFVTRKIITVNEKIEEFEIVQTSLGQWKIDLRAEFRAAVTIALNELFVRISCLAPELVFIDQPFYRPPGSKLRRIRREYAAV